MVMKNTVDANIMLNEKEDVVKNFTKLKAKVGLCKILLTTRRLIFLTKGMGLVKGRKARQQRMNAIDLDSIHRFEYYIEGIRYRWFIRLLGVFLMLLAIAVAAALRFGVLVDIAAQYPSLVPYANYVYVGAGVLFLLGLYLMFHTMKTLYIKVRSATDELTKASLKANKYNELAARYLASRIVT